MSTESDIFSELASNPSISPAHPLISDDDDMRLLNFLVRGKTNDNQHGRDDPEEHEINVALPVIQQTICSQSNQRKVPQLVDSVAERNRKNAIAAKENRLKKKRYVSELEKDNKELATENGLLTTECKELKRKVCCLEEEVLYLKSVLAHQSTLSKLLNSIGKTDVNLTTSYEAKKVSEPRQKRRKTTTSGGVCLHVTEDTVSLEFCSKCASMVCGVSSS